MLEPVGLAQDVAPGNIMDILVEMLFVFSRH